MHEFAIVVTLEEAAAHRRRMDALIEGMERRSMSEQMIDDLLWGQIDADNAQKAAEMTARDAEWEAIVNEQAERLRQYAEYEAVWNQKQTELRTELTAAQAKASLAGDLIEQHQAEIVGLRQQVADLGQAEAWTKRAFRFLNTYMAGPMVKSLKQSAPERVRKP